MIAECPELKGHEYELDRILAKSPSQAKYYSKTKKVSMHALEASIVVIFISLMNLYVAGR